MSQSRTRLWRPVARGGAVLVTAVAIAGSMMAGVGGAEASVTGGRPAPNPFSRIDKHPYLRDAFPSVPQLRKMRLWARTHRMAAFNSTAPLTGRAPSTIRFPAAAYFRAFSTR